MLKTSFNSLILCPSTIPKYFNPISSKYILGTTIFLIPSFNFEREFFTLFPKEVVSKVDPISDFNLL